MDPARRGNNGPDPTSSLLGRVRVSMADPALLANPPVAALFCLFRWLGLIAPEPYWLYVAIVVGGGVASVVSSVLWADSGRPWHRNAHVAANMAVIAVVAYSTGWGPILSIGFIFGAGAAIQHFGSKATVPSLVWTTVAIVVGQVAIAVHGAPTLIHQPVVHGVAVLGLVGALLVIELLGRTTARRETVEAELRQSERRFRALVSNAADIIVVTDQTGVMHYVSPAFDRILGRPADRYRDESMGQFPPSRRSGPDGAGVSAPLKDPSRVLTTVLRGQGADGRWRYFEATVTNHLDDPDVRGIVGNLHDITELREATERFRSAFENAPIGMAMSDLDGRITSANPAFAQIVAGARSSWSG